MYLIFSNPNISLNFMKQQVTERNDLLKYKLNTLTIKKSSWNFPDSMAGNLLKRLDTCLSNEFSKGISPTPKDNTLITS